MSLPTDSDLFMAVFVPAGLVRRTTLGWRVPCPQAACYPDPLCEEWAHRILLTKTCAPDPLDEFVEEGSNRACPLEDIRL